MLSQVFFIIFAVIVLTYVLYRFAMAVIIPVLDPVGQVVQTSSACINNYCFDVEIAKTPAQREKGLMNRTELARDKGMLFVFDREGMYPFWMKNTLIPLDIIWINQNNKIVFISKNTQPCESFICPSVAPTGKAKYVLEVNAGVSEESGFKEGDTAQIKF